MKKHFLYWLVLGLITIVACQKETSFESGGTPSDGTLQADATGDCLPKTVNGAYLVNTALVAATNTLSVQVNVNQTGTYLITTDTVNGYYFRTSGVFTSTGPTNVILRGNGTPFTAGVDNFVVSYDSTFCDIAVTVLPAGTGNAVFELAGTGGACTGAIVAGTYATSTALNASNTVTLNVIVTTIGTYNVTTTHQGMTFSGTGAFTTTGPNTVVLTGSGIPGTGGANTVPVTVGTTTCNFIVNVGSPAEGTLICASLSVVGTYTQNTALTNSNYIQVQINVNTAGAFSISSNLVSGMTFAGSGTATVGTQVVTLVGTGTPTASGAQNFTLTFGTSSCVFTVTVQPAAGGPAVGTLDGSPGSCTPASVNGTYTVNTDLTGSNTVQIQIDVQTAGTYNITATSASSPGFSFSGTGSVPAGNNQLITLNGTGRPNTAGPITFTVTFGTSTCTFLVNVVTASTDYFPRTTGSNWSYEINGDVNDSLYRYVIADLHSANSNTYNIFMARDGAAPDPDSSGYYRKNGGDYIEWFNAAAYFQYNPPTSLWSDYIMLKDNVAAGNSWNSPGWAGTLPGPPPQNVNLRFLYTIDPKDITMNRTTSTGTATYSNVIVVKEEIQFEAAPGVWQTLNIGYGKSYYARGIGLIQFLVFNSSNVETYRMAMRRYVVAP